MIALAAIAVPLLAMLACSVSRAARGAAALACIAVGGLAIASLVSASAGLRYSYAAPLRSAFLIAIDPLAALFIALCAAVCLAAVASSARVSDRRAYFALCCLALASATIVLVARDLGLFFTGWEMLLVSLAILVRHWGGPGRDEASLRLAVHGLAGSGLFLVALASIAVARGTLDIDALGARPIAASGQVLPALLFLAAFAPALAVFPLHGWSVRAFVAAPAAVAALVPGLLATAACYGIVRVCLGLFPQGMAAAAPVLVAFAVIGAVYAALVGTRQDDLRRLIAFAVISQQGLAAFALFAGTTTAIRGAIVITIANGLGAAAFILIGAAVAARSSSFLFSRTGGLGGSAPRLAALATIVALVATGVPGSAAFAGDILAIAGTYERFPAAAVIAAAALVVQAACGAAFIRRALDGPRLAEAPRDAGWRETALVGLLIAAIFVVGLVPRLVTDRIGDDALPAVEAAP